MISPDHIRAAFATLRAVGYPVPAAWVPASAHPRDIRDAQDAADDAVRVWRNVLADVDSEELSAALIAWMRSPGAKFWPLPGQVLELIPRRTLAATEASAAVAMWRRVVDLVRTAPVDAPEPPYLAPDSPEVHLLPALRAGIDAVGGWRHLLRAGEREWSQAHFVKAFDAEIGRSRSRDGVAELVALAGAQRTIPGAR